MSFIMIDFDDQQAQAAVINNSQIITVKNLQGEYVFYGKNLFTDEDALLHILTEMISCGKKQTITLIDSIYIVHPVDMPIKVMATLRKLCDSLGFKIVRFMTRSLAMMSYLFVNDLSYKNSQGVFTLFHGRNEKVECISCEYGDDLLEVLYNENFKHISKLEDCYRGYPIKQSHMIISGEISKRDRIAIQSFSEKYSIPCSYIKKDHVLAGAAFYASKLMGYQCDLLIFDIANQDLGIAIKENAFAQLLNKSDVISLKNVLKVYKEDIIDNKMVFSIGSMQRGFHSFEIPLVDFGEADWYEISMNIDVNRNISLRIISSNGRYYETDLFDEILKSGKESKKEILYEENREMKLIEAIDNLKRSIEYADRSGNHDISKGLYMIKGQMDDYLKEFGITAIEAVGKPFDIRFHKAMDHFEEASLGENMVVSEYKTGYMKDGKVIRFSEVVVVN